MQLLCKHNNAIFLKKIAPPCKVDKQQSELAFRGLCHSGEDTTVHKSLLLADCCGWTTGGLSALYCQAKRC